MSSSDDNSKLPTPDLAAGGVYRRGFLKYVAAAFSTAMLPEVLEACSNAVEGSGGIPEVAESVDFTSVPMTWVARKEDGLSLGFQFSGLVSDANHNLALASGTTAGNAFIAVTFPPQHVIEDATLPGTTPALPVNSYASGTSRIVFQVPATYGASGGIALVPYNLQGVLGLCARCTTAVSANAASNAGHFAAAAKAAPLADAPALPQSFARARIDRVIARVDPEAAGRVVARTAAVLDTDYTVIHLPPHYGTAPVAPANGETSIELPHRLLLSPNEAMAWSYAAAPVTAAASGRTELWNVRMGVRNPITGVADPSLGGLAMRALWTRDYDLYPAPASGPRFASLIKEPVVGPVPTLYDRDRIVQDTGNMIGTAPPPLVLGRMMLTPLGGTLDVKADFANDVALLSWVQRTTLGRDEYAKTITRGYLLPFGHVASLISINKRNDNPAKGPVGVLYNTTYLAIGQPLVAYQGRSNAADYNTFPFVAVELTQGEIPCSDSINLGTPGPVLDPTGKYNPLIGCIGTDHKGRAIRFTTQVYWVPANNDPGVATGYLNTGISAWNASKASQGYGFDGQRIAYASPPSSDSSGSSAFSADSTSFETTSFGITLQAPSSPVPKTGDNVVPVARSIQIGIEAVRHLTTSTSSGSAPNASAIFDYDRYAYAANGFNTAANPHEIFLVYTAPAPGQTAAPTIDFAGDASKSGALVTPQMAVHALSRAAGPMSGTLPPNVAPAAGTAPANASTALFAGTFDPTDFFKSFNPLLFGFVPLSSIVQLVANAAGSLASQYMPKTITQDISNAEAFLQKAMALYQAVQQAGALLAGSAQSPSLITVAQRDAAAFNLLVASGKNAAGTILTAAEKAALTAAASAATAAASTIQTYVSEVQAIGTAGGVVATDITSLSFTALLGTNGMDGDLGKLVNAVQAFLTSLATLQSSGTPLSAAGQAAAAASSYLASLATSLQRAVTTVQSFLTQAGQLLADLNALARGLELPKNLSVELKWQPLIQGIECGGLVAFVPSTAHALTLDVAVNAKAVNGTPAGANVTCRLDQFAIAFGGQIPASDAGGSFQPLSPTTYGIPQAIEQADVTLVFDHMQFKALAGQKPDVDVVFSDIHFGGPLKFIETLKNILPLDAFSDPPFVDVTTSGITAGFNLAVPDVAIGMFSLENMAISASLTMPFITTGNSGVSFTFDFCTPANPFLVTVAMLGGGGFFGMKMDMHGMERVQFGVEVAAQLAFNFLDIVSGCISIEVGIFFVYVDPSAVAAGNDPVTGLTEVGGWTYGGYLRLRGELDIAGLITVSIELYLQITYESATGKCIASGYIQLDVHILFFSLDVTIPFSRTFAGSNGDPTFVQLMSPGGVDPMIDPTLTGAVANSTWDPFAEYCMAYA